MEKILQRESFTTKDDSIIKTNSTSLSSRFPRRYPIKDGTYERFGRIEQIGKIAEAVVCAGLEQGNARGR